MRSQMISARQDYGKRFTLNKEVVFMATKGATAEVFWTAFRSLPKKEREAIVEKLLRDREFREDLMI